jgi:hypothetical protein
VLNAFVILAIVAAICEAGLRLFSCSRSGSEVSIIECILCLVVCLLHSISCQWLNDVACKVVNHWVAGIGQDNEIPSVD